MALPLTPEAAAMVARLALEEFERTCMMSFIRYADWFEEPSDFVRYRPHSGKSFVEDRNTFYFADGRGWPSASRWMIPQPGRYW